VARREDEPPIWNRSRIAFASTCPKCGEERSQHGYTHRILLSLLNRRSNIDAYCIECNVCWPISEAERRVLAPQLNGRLQKCNDAPSAWCSQRRAPHDRNWRGARGLSDGQLSLQQALRILCGIRLRYAIDHGNSEVGVRSVLVTLSGADMLWINAAIEALRKAIAADAAEAAERAARAGPET